MFLHLKNVAVVVNCLCSILGGRVSSNIPRVYREVTTRVHVLAGIFLRALFVWLHIRQCSHRFELPHTLCISGDTHRNLIPTKKNLSIVLLKQYTENNTLGATTHLLVGSQVIQPRDGRSSLVSALKD